ncbi:MAG: hypothetical protein DMF51_03270 [Acidobacteria bacterium]|nr:MAG: hypothetical protein DMF51_03270 [Acidobacteriota bacterium]
MRPLLGLDLLHPGILDAGLLAQQLDLLPEALELRPEAEAGVEALGGPAEGGGQGEFCEGDGVHSRRADVTGTASKRRKGTDDTGHGHPPGEWQE